MSEADRQRRLHVENRLAELRTKYGRDIEDLEPPDQPIAPPLQPPDPVAPHTLTLAEALGTLDRYGETALFECPRCGEESGKASVPLGIWFCTACHNGDRLPRERPKGSDW